MTVAFIILGVLSLWGAVCNHRTGAQKHKILANIKRVIYEEDGIKRANQMLNFYELVSYEAHMWRLFCFRNPKYLYHFSLWKFLP